MNPINAHLLTEVESPGNGSFLCLWHLGAVRPRIKLRWKHPSGRLPSTLITVWSCDGIYSIWSVSDGRIQRLEISRTVEIGRDHVLVSVHTLFIVVGRCLIVLVVFIVAGMCHVMLAILLTPWLSLAGSTLQLVKLGEDALGHGSRSFTCPVVGSKR